jgi:hypothetical protein
VLNLLSVVNYISSGAGTLQWLALEFLLFMLPGDVGREVACGCVYD